jgi:hypothetical protein
MPRPYVKRPRSYVKHGLVTLDKSIQRRLRKGRSLIDRRSSAGKNAMRVQQNLLDDLGGAEKLSTAKLILVELIGRDVFYLDETDRRIFKVLKEYPAAKNNPKAMNTLYGYRSTVASNLLRNLAALGFEKALPQEKTLDEILAEDEGDEQQTNGSAG